MKKDKLILVVEDDHDWQSILKLTLLKAGYVCDVVDSLQGAEDNLSSKNYDLIITDMRLLSFDENNFEGLSLVRSLRKSKLDVKVIVVSAYVTSEMVRELFQTHSISDFIDKRSFDRSEIIPSVERVLLSSTNY